MTPVGGLWRRRSARAAQRAHAETGTRLVVRPTARGLGVVVVLATLVVLAALANSAGPLALVAGLATALLVGPNQAWARARRAVRGVRVYAHVVPPMVPVGGSSSLALSVANGSRRPIPALGLQSPDGRWEPLRHSSAPVRRATWGRRVLDLVVAPSTVTLVPLPGLEPSGSTSVDFVVPTRRRGMFAVDQLCLWAHDSWGLFGAVVAVVPSAVVVVHPRRAFGVEVPLSADAGITAAHMAVVTARPSDTEVGGEFADLRPYVPGDRLHLLHWPAFARYGTLLVRRFDPEVGGAVRIVVDDRVGVHRRDAFEGALSATLAIVTDAADLGIAIELATLSGWHATVVPTPDGVADVLPLLATLQPRRQLPDAQLPDWFDSESGPPTIVTTDTGERRLPSSLDRSAKVVVR
jgi:uncharacterized protein (DUF58 family)